MKILIAPDSYKGSLSATEAANAIEKGIKRVMPGANITKVPMADGGEGTIDSLLAGSTGKLSYKKVTGPMGKPVRARYGNLNKGKTAVIEMAEASGLMLVKAVDRNPMKASSYGTGELILEAIAKGSDKLIIGIGGSATIDGGMGMAQALGVRFYNNKGKLIEAAGNGHLLSKIVSIDVSQVNPEVYKCGVIVASDVQNPLCGKQGAANIFGAQKGATAKTIIMLDKNLRHFVKIIKKELGKDISKEKMTGAAGGLGMGLKIFAKAKLQSGIDIVIESNKLKDHIKKADLVITGEGQIDAQTLFGKAPAGVALLSKKLKVPVVMIGGGLADDASDVFKIGVDGLEGTVIRYMSFEEGHSKSSQYLSDAAERVIRLVLLGKKMNKTNQS